MKNLAIYILSAALFFSCDHFKKKETETTAEENRKVLARVADKYLYDSDLEGIQGENLSKEDSASLVKRYIDSWIMKQLLLIKAEAKIDELDPETQEKILDCRNTLLIHSFENNFLEERLDTSIHEKDLKNYYDTNIDRFQLKQNIIKGIFIKVPKDAPKVEKVKNWIQSSKVKDLKSYCVRFASHYVLEDTTWINFDELIQNSPFSNINDRADFLEKTSYHEISDDKYWYFLKIKDYKISKQISPYEFVKDQIKNSLISKKRIELINELKVNIYKEAETNKEFEIYSEK